MAIFIDRRLNGKGKSSENRQKFLKRVRGAIKEQMPHIINSRNISDMDTKGGNIRVKKNKTISEPSFSNGKGGTRDSVIPGNVDFIPGDSIFKPESSGGMGRGASPDGQGEDDFIVEISKKEFLDFLFEDLELPDLVLKELSKLTTVVKKHAGYSTDGAPNKLSIVRSFKQSLARRIPIKSKIERELNLLRIELDFMEDPEDPIVWTAEAIEHRDSLVQQIEKLEAKLKKIPFLDPIDLRYKQSKQVEIPTTHATMIMIMDNSGSMGLKEKTIARKFFYLLYAFLMREYEEIDLVFISHTSVAREMSESEFFTTTESGGTVVSTALDLTADIIDKRLAGKTNIYVCQVSDGDNFDSDDQTCFNLLTESIMPLVQYYAYIQVDDYHGDEDDEKVAQTSIFLLVRRAMEKSLWKTYEKVAKVCSNFQMKRVFAEKDIYHVFKSLFEKKIK